MVTITVYIEGGIVEHLNDASATIDNSGRLREAFHKLLRNAINEGEFKLIIELRGGWESTINYFIKNFTPNSLLLIDLDGSELIRSERLIEFGLEGYGEASFFMIQKMEAWILSQIDKVDSHLSENYKKTRLLRIGNDKSIVNKDPKLFRHPDDVLKTIIAKYFVTEKNGKQTKLKYGKLKHAPQLLEILEIEKLKADFVDVLNLLNKMSNL